MDPSKYISLERWSYDVKNTSLIYLSIYLSIDLFIYLSIHPSIHLSVSLSIVIPMVLPWFLQLHFSSNLTNPTGTRERRTQACPNLHCCGHRGATGYLWGQSRFTALHTVYISMEQNGMQRNVMQSIECIYIYIQSFALCSSGYIMLYIGYVM